MCLYEKERLFEIFCFFQLEYEVDLKSALKELGLQNVFDSTSSSFDHLTDQPLTFAKCK